MLVPDFTKDGVFTGDDEISSSILREFELLAHLLFLVDDVVFH